MFDVRSFEQQEFEKPAESTYTPIPAGEYVGQIGVEEKDLSIATGEKNGNPWARLDLWVYLADPSGTLKATHGDKPRYRLGIMLDLQEGSTPDAPKLDFGPNRNLDLGRLQKAIGVDHKGWRFSEFRGKSLRVKLGVGPRKDKPELQENKLEAISAA